MQVKACNFSLEPVFPKANQEIRWKCALLSISTFHRLLQLQRCVESFWEGQSTCLWYKICSLRSGESIVRKIIIVQHLDQKIRNESGGVEISREPLSSEPKSGNLMKTCSVESVEYQHVSSPSSTLNTCKTFLRCPINMIAVCNFFFKSRGV